MKNYLTLKCTFYSMHPVKKAKKITDVNYNFMLIPHFFKVHIDWTFYSSNFKHE